MVICESHILTILHKKFKCEPCTEWCAKVCGCKLWIQLYLSMQSCLLQPSFCQVLPVLVHVPSQPTPACRLSCCCGFDAWHKGQMIRAMAWLQLVPNTSAVKAVLPTLSPLVTSSLSIIVIFISDQLINTIGMQSNQRMWHHMVPPICPLAITWPVVIKW